MFMLERKRPCYFVSRVEANAKGGFVLHITTMDAAEDIKRRLEACRRNDLEYNEKPFFSFELQKVDAASAQAQLIFEGNITAAVQTLYDCSCLSYRHALLLQNKLPLPPLKGQIVGCSIS